MANRKQPPLFLAVVKNTNALARADNANIEETDAEYLEAKEKFITIAQSKMVSGEGLACECCKVEMSAGFHIHHIDGDHTNNDYETNFSLRCPFCHLVEHIGRVGVENKGIIIYAPNISQEALNVLQLTAYALEHYLSTLKNDSIEHQQTLALCAKPRSIMRTLETGRIWVENIFQTSDPEHFANIFLGMTEDEYERREQGTFHGLRLLYKKEAFKDEIALFAKTMFGMHGEKNTHSLHPSQWLSKAQIFHNQMNEKKI